MDESSPPKLVAVALDASAGSTDALEWALENVVVPNKDKVLLVTVRPSTLTAATGQPGFHVSAKEVREEGQQKKMEGMSLLEKYKEACETRHIACEMRVMIGDARIAICEAAQEAKADALVVGSRGHGALKRLVLGSVSEYCVHNCECPVVVVRPNAVGTPITSAPVE